MPKMYLKYIQNIPHICPYYAKDILKICTKYVKCVPNIWPIYAQAVSKIYQKYNKQKNLEEIINEAKLRIPFPILSSLQQPNPSNASLPKAAQKNLNH